MVYSPVPREEEEEEGEEEEEEERGESASTDRHQPQRGEEVVLPSLLMVKIADLGNACWVVSHLCHPHYTCHLSPPLPASSLHRRHSNSTVSLPGGPAWSRVWPTG